MYVTFGCSPNEGVRAESTLAKGYSQCVIDFVKKNAGVLIIH